MRIITSISPKRVDVHRRCVDSWKRVGAEVVSVNHPRDVRRLRGSFPDVEFSTEGIGAPLYPHMPWRPAIRSLIHHGPGLIINSDIEIACSKRQFVEDWADVPNTLKVGIRSNVFEDGTIRLEGCGIDAFLVTEEIREKFRDVGFVIGAPVWDYWMIWEATQLGMAVFAVKKHLLHEKHKVAWKRADLRIGKAIIEHHYGQPLRALARMAKSKTGRLGKRNEVHYGA